MPIIEMFRRNETKNNRIRNRNRSIKRRISPLPTGDGNYKGAGLIILSPDCKYTLLVKGTKYPQKWGFPKGHREPYDRDSLETALREVYEETGLTEDDFYIIPDSFHSAKDYIFRYAFLKRPILETQIYPQEEEVYDTLWGLIDLIRTRDEIYQGGNIHLRNWIDDLQNNRKLSTIIFDRFRISHRR